MDDILNDMDDILDDIDGIMDDLDDILDDNINNGEYFQGFISR